MINDLEIHRRHELMTGAGHILGNLSERAMDDARFREFLAEFAAAGSRVLSSRELLELFCRRARAYFAASTAYVWQFLRPDQLEGWEADGWMAEQFRGTRLNTSETAIVAAAIQTGKARYVNAVDASRHPVEAKFEAKSLLVAPLVVFGEVIGAAVWTHRADPNFFRQDHVEKAMILAVQLGTRLESARLAEQTKPKEEERRSDMLVEVAPSMPGAADSSLLVELVAEKLRLLLESPLVCVFTRTADGFELAAAAARDPVLSASLRTRREGKGLQFAADISRRAVVAGELITVSVNPASHFVGDIVPAGTLLAVPFSTSSKEGAVLVYPRREATFSSQEKKLLPVVTSLAALAIRNAELCTTANSQAHELEQILTIAGELGSISDLNRFMRRILERAVDFLGFGRAFVGLLEHDRLEVRWTYPDGEDGALGYGIPEGIVTRAMLSKEVFSSDDLEKAPGPEAEDAAEFHLPPMLAVPLVGAGGEPLGAFGVLDQHEHRPISQEDVRRAQALAGYIAAAIQVCDQSLLSPRHRERPELTKLAFETTSLPRGGDLAHKLLERAARIAEASDAALVMEAGSAPSVRVLHSLTVDPNREAGFGRNVISALRASLETVLTRAARELFGGPPPEDTRWDEVVLVRLTGAGGELLGGVCLANCRMRPGEEREQLLEAISEAASVSVESARYFTRLEQANHQWMEIFDAIPDFIVAHDGAGNVLRVNRALADFVGVQPQQLNGLNIAHLVAIHPSGPLVGSCPFCRPTGEFLDEYLHPVLARTFLVSTSQVDGSSGEGLETVHVLKDITERREAERRYGELFDDIQEGLFFSSPDGRFIEVNHALVRMLGRRSREELLESNPVEDVFLAPDEHAALFAEMERYGSLRNRAAVLKRKDGSPLHVLINAFAIHGSQGQVTQYRWLIQDITGLKTYQTELDRERDFSGKILENTQSLILVADTAGIVSYANRRWQVLGYEPEAIVGNPLESLVAPSSHEVFQRAYSAILYGDQVDNLGLEVLRADRRARQFSVNMSPMRDEHGEVTSIVVVIGEVQPLHSIRSSRDIRSPES